MAKRNCMKPDANSFAIQVLSDGCSLHRTSNLGSKANTVSLIGPGVAYMDGSDVLGILFFVGVPHWGLECVFSSVQFSSI